MNRVRSILAKEGSIRIGFFSHEIGSDPIFYLLSTNHNEDPSYYAKPSLHMYDTLEHCLYYMIRYEISEDTYNVLSGLSPWTDTIYNEIVVPRCPDELDDRDEHRYMQEYYS